MNQNARLFAALAATLLVGNAFGVGCGGKLTTESTDTGGSGGVAGTGGSTGTSATGGVGGSSATGGSTGGTGDVGGSGGTTGGVGGTGGSTGGGGGVGGSTGGIGGTGGSTGGIGGTGGVTGGSGGVGGSFGGRAGAGGTTPPGSIQCGTRICNAVTSMLGTMSPCCPVGEINACGAIVAVAQNACITTTRGTPNARCPAITVTGVSLPGCCRPNGLCGVSTEVISLGCVDPTTLGGMPGQPCN